MTLSGSVSKTSKSARAIAAQTGIMARYTNPLPRKTVAKKNGRHDSLGGLGSQQMNHRKAMPANGASRKTSERAFECSMSSVADPRGLAGIDFRMSTSIRINNVEKITPAIAAARGVFRLSRTKLASRSTGYLTDLPPTGRNNRLEPIVI